VKSRDPLYSGEDIYGIFSAIRASSTHAESSRASWTPGEFEEYRLEYGETLLWDTRASGLGGRIVANQKKACADAGARLGPKTHRIWRRDLHGVRGKSRASSSSIAIKNRIPLIFLHDVNGFMVGKDAEWSGIIRAGAKW